MQSVLTETLPAAELSTIYTRNGGYITWVFESLGPYWGFINGANSLLSNLFDLPIYPVLFAEYVAQVWPWAEGGVQKWILKACALAIVVALNCRGLEIVALTSIGFTLFVLAPFCVEPFLAPPQLGSVGHSRGEIEWAPFIAALLWSMQGWDSLGCIAGEVKDGRSTYPYAVGIASLIIVANYVVPVAVGAGVERDYDEWDDGSFAKIARKIAPWLGIWVVVAASCSVLGEFNAVMSTSSRALQRMADFGMVPRFLGWRVGPGRAPVPAILAQAVFVAFLMSFSFSELAVIDTASNNVSLLLEIASFLYLKHTKPGLRRPFAVPFGTWGGWAISIPKFIVIVFFFAILEVNWQLWVIAGFNAAALVGGYFWSRTDWAQRCLEEASTPEELLGVEVDSDEEEGEGQGGSGLAGVSGRGGAGGEDEGDENEGDEDEDEEEGKRGMRGRRRGGVTRAASGISMVGRVKGKGKGEGGRGLLAAGAAGARAGGTFRTLVPDGGSSDDLLDASGGSDGLEDGEGEGEDGDLGSGSPLLSKASGGVNGARSNGRKAGARQVQYGTV